MVRWLSKSTHEEKLCTEVCPAAYEEPKPAPSTLQSETVFVPPEDSVISFEKAAKGGCCRRCFNFVQWLKGEVRELLAVAVLRPLRMTDADAKIAGRIERMAFSCIYTFFKCLVSCIIEYQRGWLFAGITFNVLALSIPLLFYFAMIWRHVALTTAFLLLNASGFAVSLSIWIIFLTNIIRRETDKDAGVEWFLRYEGGKLDALTYFSLVTMLILVVALLVNTIESLHFVRFIQRSEESRKESVQGQIDELIRKNESMQFHLFEMEDYITELETMFLPLQQQSLRNSFIRNISAGLDPAVPTLDLPLLLERRAMSRMARTESSALMRQQIINRRTSASPPDRHFRKTYLGCEDDDVSGDASCDSAGLVSQRKIARSLSNMSTM